MNTDEMIKMIYNMCCYKTEICVDGHCKHEENDFICPIGTVIDALDSYDIMKWHELPEVPCNSNSPIVVYIRSDIDAKVDYYGIWYYSLETQTWIDEFGIHRKDPNITSWRYLSMFGTEGLRA